MKKLTEELSDIGMMLCEHGTRLPSSITFTMKSKEDCDLLVEQIAAEAVSGIIEIPANSERVTYYSTVNTKFIFNIDYESN